MVHLLICIPETLTFLSALAVYRVLTAFVGIATAFIAHFISISTTYLQDTKFGWLRENRGVLFANIVLGNLYFTNIRPMHTSSTAKEMAGTAALGTAFFWYAAFNAFCVSIACGLCLVLGEVSNLDRVTFDGEVLPSGINH